MAQYSKDIFNLAPGLGRAINDPREAEARAKEASARAEQDLRSQIQARLENQRLQQQQIQLSGQQQLANQQYQQSQLQQQGSQFDRSLQARTQEQAAQREFQRMMQGEQLDSTEARFNAQQGMQADQFAQTFGRQVGRDAVADDQFAQTFGRQLNRDQIGDQRYNSGLEYRDSRDLVQDRFAERGQELQGAQLAQQVWRDQTNMAQREMEFDINKEFKEQEIALRQQGLSAAKAKETAANLRAIVSPLLERGGPVSHEDLLQATKMGKLLGIPDKQLNQALGMIPGEKEGAIMRFLRNSAKNTELFSGTRQFLQDNIYAPRAGVPDWFNQTRVVNQNFPTNDDAKTLQFPK